MTVTSDSYIYVSYKSFDDIVGGVHVSIDVSISVRLFWFSIGWHKYDGNQHHLMPCLTLYVSDLGTGTTPNLSRNLWIGLPRV